MDAYRVFDIIGPRMVGPSSSHTAGAVRLGAVARKLSGEDVRRAQIVLYGSFAQTGRGHGTDLAITAGLLGLPPDDERIRRSPELARENCVQIQIDYSNRQVSHPNTARILVANSQEQRMEMVGASVGGGRIQVQQINGMEVSFGCDYPTMLLFYRDQPGIAGMVTGFLGERRINIAFMRVFRDARYQNACMVIESDEQIPRSVLQQVRQSVPSLTEVCVL